MVGDAFQQMVNFFLELKMALFNQDFQIHLSGAGSDIQAWIHANLDNYVSQFHYREILRVEVNFGKMLKANILTTCIFTEVIFVDGKFDLAGPD